MRVGLILVCLLHQAAADDDVRPRRLPAPPKPPPTPPGEATEHCAREDWIAYNGVPKAGTSTSSPAWQNLCASGSRRPGLTWNVARACRVSHDSRCRPWSLSVGHGGPGISGERPGPNVSSRDTFSVRRLRQVFLRDRSVKVLDVTAWGCGPKVSVHWVAARRNCAPAASRLVA